MICPQCEKQNQTSRVEHRGTVETAMNVDSYWENGARHIHNPNCRIYRYYCSKGHKFEYECYQKCPSCGYNYDMNKLGEGTGHLSGNYIHFFREYT